MSITFDAVNKRIILDSAAVSATEIYSRWVDWAALSDNAKYGMVIRQVGSDDLGGGLSIPPYYFLQDGWRVRPMEANHLLILTGNLFVEGGGQPVVNTLGPYNVSIQYTVPVQAQAFNSGGGSGLTPTQDAALMQAASESSLVRKLTQNRAVISSNGTVVTIYDDDGVTPLHVFNVSPDKNERTPV